MNDSRGRCGSKPSDQVLSIRGGSRCTHEGDNAQPVKTSLLCQLFYNCNEPELQQQIRDWSPIAVVAVLTGSQESDPHYLHLQAFS